MDAEVSEVFDVLSTHPPFSELSHAEQRMIVSASHMRYFRRGTIIMQEGAPNNSLYLVRSGAVDLDVDTGLMERNGPGETFGSASLLSKAPSRYRATAIEDTLALVIPGNVFEELFEKSETVREYFEPRIRNRLAKAARDIEGGDSPLLRLSAEDLIQREPITASPDVSIREAAEIMTDHGVSALLLTDQEGNLAGIVTDRDLRRRVVLTAHDINAPISEVMTQNPVIVSPNFKAFELLLTMTHKKVHHLPIVKDRKPLGLVSAGDVMRLETSNPVFIIEDIQKQKTPAGVAEIAKRAPLLAQRLLDQGLSAEDVSHVLTTIADSATIRLIKLAEEEFGPAPHPWTWIVLGSQARRELGPGSDQDHAMLLSNKVTDDTWYKQVAERVVEGLELAGFERCPGDTMATNWRMTLSDWRRQFQTWINAPDSMAILHSQIFFDARPVYGEHGLFELLWGTVLPAARGAQRFLGNLAAMAVRREPPLGFFRGFVVEGQGEHKDSLDIKAGGLHAIIESVRVLALASGIAENGTLARIEALRESEKISDDRASDLTDAFRLIADLRLRRQVEMANRGETPDNWINPDDLTSAQRRHLKYAFTGIRQAQQGLQHQFQTHLMN